MAGRDPNAPQPPQRGVYAEMAQPAVGTPQLSGKRSAAVAVNCNALVQLDLLWDELFPAEQARIVQLLVARVDVSTSGVTVHLRTDGMGSLVADLSHRPVMGQRRHDRQR